MTAGPTARRPRPPSPEFIGGVSAVVIILLIATTALAASRGLGSPATPAGASDAPPSQAVASAVPTPTPPVDPGVVKFLRSLNEQLAVNGEALQNEIDRSRLRIDEVQTLIRGVNSRAAVGSEVVAGLGGKLGPKEPGGRMAAPTPPSPEDAGLTAPTLSED